MMRLDKYLSERLGIPRGESRKLAAKGRVTVNGVLTKKADTQIEEATAEVAVDGRLLAGAYQKYVYLMLNKPEGVVSAAQDKRDTTVVDLVKDAFPRRQLFPAGRLDKTSTGFVLLTDDGTLAHDILAPGRHVPKQYLVTLDTPLTNAMRVGFAAGVTLADGQTLAELEPTPTVPLPRAQLRTVLQDPTSNAGALRQFFTAILAQVRYARPSRDAPFTLELEFLA